MGAFKEAHGGTLMELYLGESAAEKEKDLKKDAKEALQQIKDRQYTTDMEARDVTDYILLGFLW